jgi:hypothetical protein
MLYWKKRRFIGNKRPGKDAYGDRNTKLLHRCESKAKGQPYQSGGKCGGS